MGYLYEEDNRDLLCFRFVDLLIHEEQISAVQHGDDGTGYDGLGDSQHNNADH